MDVARETGSGAMAWRVAPVHAALAVTSLAGAGIHFAVMGEHFEEYLLFGLFFALLGWFQALWALAVVVSPTRWVLVAGLVVNALVVGVWVVSRTSGLPIGPHAGSPEPAALLDVLSTLLEIGIVVVTTYLLLLNRAPRTSETRGDGRRMVTALVLGLVLFSTVAFAVGGHEHGDSAARCLRSAATRTSWCFSTENGWSRQMNMDGENPKRMQGEPQQGDQEHAR